VESCNGSFRAAAKPGRAPSAAGRTIQECGGDLVTRKAVRRSGGKKRGAASGGHAEVKDRATEVMTAVRLVLTAWDLVWTIVRDHAAGGGPGRIL
jgi:hypothetical protein